MQIRCQSSRKLMKNSNLLGHIPPLWLCSLYILILLKGVQCLVLAILVLCSAYGAEKLSCGTAKVVAYQKCYYLVHIFVRHHYHLVSLVAKQQCRGPAFNSRLRHVVTLFMFPFSFVTNYFLHLSLIFWRFYSNCFQINTTWTFQLWYESTQLRRNINSRSGINFKSITLVMPKLFKYFQDILRSTFLLFCLPFRS